MMREAAAERNFSDDGGLAVFDNRICGVDDLA
jgi:hypothetical protein